ncbi:cache domain-containing sensor histidine kinase [Gorillibacterium sp. sgz500922]|uniref:cache domain-containing sensor histidine kinase n=1 Tax=Gorillibacterium sp. sgz500922 TaxID=3446694 RepID=UPI003F668946
MTRKMSILGQLISGFSFLILTTVIAIILLTYRSSSQVVLERSNQYILESVKQLQGKLDVILQEHDNLSSSIIFSPTIQEALQDADTGQPPRHSEEEIVRYLDEATRNISYDVLIRIYDRKGNPAYSNTSSIDLIWDSEAQVKGAYWYPAIVQNQGHMVWQAADGWLNNSIPIILGTRQINDWEKLNGIGTFFLVLPIQVLDNAVGQFHLNPNEKIQISDPYGTIVYSTDHREIGEYMDPGLLQKFSSRKPHIVPLKSDSAADTYISYSYSTYSGWSLFAYIDAKEAVKDLSTIQRRIFFVGLCGLAAALAFTIFYSWTLSRPIRSLATKLANVERGTRIPYMKTTLNKELDILYTSYNSMLQNLDRTIADLTSKQVSEKQAQITALKAQFRPHFLYNTLNTIYWALVGKRLKEESQMVLALSDLLRYSIERGSEFVTVEEDLAQLNRFILLQKLRYEDKLQVEIRTDPEVLSCRIMKLTLQPLVENAITHGLETVVRDTWQIRIDIRREDNMLVLTVEDNGKGMTPEEMAQALAGSEGDIPSAGGTEPGPAQAASVALEDSPPRPPAASQGALHSGIGLANLHTRILLIYGREYGLSLSVSEWNGLKVTVTFPLLYEDPEVYT